MKSTTKPAVDRCHLGGLRSNNAIFAGDHIPMSLSSFRGCELVLLKAIFVATLLSPTFFSPAVASYQGDLRSRHGDWELRCEKSLKGGRDHCALMQSARQDDADLTVVVLKTAKELAVLRVLAPLGVQLASDQRDLQVDIDGVSFGYLAFVRCIPEGCVAEHIMTTTDLQKLIAFELMKSPG